MSSQWGSVPKFGEWDVNNPASADGYTVIFKKAREKKRAAGFSGGHIELSPRKHYKDTSKPPPIKKWLCCAHIPY